VGQLKHYRNTFGHVNVPKDWDEVPGLGDWCETQRRVRKSLCINWIELRSYTIATACSPHLCRYSRMYHYPPNKYVNWTS
jgi:hypothetical protein